MVAHVHGSVFARLRSRGPIGFTRETSGRLFRTAAVLLLSALALTALAGSASATVEGDVAVSEGVLLQSDSPGTVDVEVEWWDSDARRYRTVETFTSEVGAGEHFLRFHDVDESGTYRVSLNAGGAEDALEFTHRTSSDALNLVEDFSADSAGPTLLLGSGSSDLTVGRALLLDSEGRVIDAVDFDEREIAGNSMLEGTWSASLADGESYRSVSLFTRGDRTSGETDSFTAETDAALPSLTPDENGVTATVAGDSQVPLSGTVDLVLRSGGDEVHRFEKSVEELTAGEERDVTVYWDDVLDPGTYTVDAVLRSGAITLDSERTSFEVEHEAEITDAFGAGVGASVTVEGKSDLPLDGDVRIKLLRDGEVVRTETMPAPVVLSGNEESVDTEWSDRLQPGRYVLVAELVTDSGVIDRYGETFEAQTLDRGEGSQDEAQSGDGGGPMSKMPAAGAALALVAVLTSAFLLRRA